METMLSQGGNFPRDLVPKQENGLTVRVGVARKFFPIFGMVRGVWPLIDQKTMLIFLGRYGHTNS